ncbi:hypothetical protein [Neoaquamicrobium sediminum]|uniref:hypothetical protein n=1 Tax=Neoaquamicrobium sediminum TaxID=1849104 RepID=UPI001566EE7A|nr:hypothetical protein [Mesorhizobium sediminum]NRC54159.1 hypothetical protein [Mesorhizobium sediminum]
MTENNYTIGRGEVWIDGRCIGNTDLLQFGFKYSRYRILMICQNISMENLQMFFGGERKVDFKFVPKNPVGKQFTFEIDQVRLTPAKYDVKGDAWQGLAFELSVSSRGSIADQIRITEGDKLST